MQGEITMSGEDDMTKITIESGDETVSVSRDRDYLNISEMLELVRSALVASGYHPDTVERGFLEK